MAKPDRGERARATGTPRYVVRRGTKRGRGEYLVFGHGLSCDRRQANALRFTLDEARVAARACGGRVVRLLSREEGRRRFAAAELLAAVERIRPEFERWCHLTGLQGGPGWTEADLLKRVMDDLRARAEHLWPVGAKRAGGRGPRPLWCRNLPPCSELPKHERCDVCPLHKSGDHRGRPPC